MNVRFLTLSSQQKTMISLLSKSVSVNLEELESLYANQVCAMSESRREEFLRGRYLAHQLLEKQGGSQAYIGKKERMPVWPQGYIGSISHSKDYIVAACSQDDVLYGVGIDIETAGRIRKGMEKKIMTADDIVDLEGVDSTFVKTLIFSAKEALFKALYPLCEEFFGMLDASVIKIDQHSFVIRLDRSLSGHLKQGLCLKGYFQKIDNSVVSLVEYLKGQ